MPLCCMDGGGLEKMPFLYRGLENAILLYRGVKKTCKGSNFGIFCIDGSNFSHFLYEGVKFWAFLYRDQNRKKLYRGISKMPFSCIGGSKMSFFVWKVSKMPFCSIGGLKVPIFGIRGSLKKVSKGSLNFFMGPHFCNPLK